MKQRMRPTQRVNSGHQSTVTDKTALACIESPANRCAAFTTFALSARTAKRQTFTGNIDSVVYQILKLL